MAASPNDELSDTHWLRTDVDQFLVNEAIALGVDYHDLVDLDGIEWQPTAIRCCEERDRVGASASARSSSSMRQGREDF